jgi:nicotinamide-nucleotide amidase
LGRPQGLAFDSTGNLYVAASLSGKRGIVKITPDAKASLEVAGHGLVGLAFAPGRSVILFRGCRCCRSSAPASCDREPYLVPYPRPPRFSFTLLPVNAEIIAVGSELLTPFRMDTNSLYLTEQINQLGVEVVFKSVVGDDLRRLVEAAQHALFRSEIVIFSGGLGPTEDDLTREAVAESLGISLRRDEEVLAGIVGRFAAHGWKMSSNNAKQADVLEGATVLPNANGTAPGQWLSGKFDGRERIVILLPGPPHELKALFEAECRQRLRAKLPAAFLATRVLKVAMLGESYVDARVAPIYKRYSDVQTTILAGTGEIQLHFKSRADTIEVAQARVDEAADAVEEELDDAVFSRNGESLEQIVGYWLQMRNATLAVAESCTGGDYVGRRQLALLCRRRDCLL